MGGSVHWVASGWFSRRAIGYHAALAILVPACAALCDWQVHRALSGNDLSWAYVFEWPFFAGYGTYVWWRLVHDQLPGRAADAPPVQIQVEPTAERRAEEADAEAELAAYNRYLAELHANGPPKRW